MKYSVTSAPPLSRLAKLATVLLLAVPALPTQAQTPTGPWPVIEANVYMHPVGGRVPMRFLAKQSGMEHEVWNGAFNIDYQITCQGGRCPTDQPPRVLRRGITTIPCGSSESGPVGFSLVHLPSSFPDNMRAGKTTFTLRITRIQYDKYEDGMVDNINRKYGYNTQRYNRQTRKFEDFLWVPCQKGTYTGDKKMGMDKSVSMNLN